MVRSTSVMRNGRRVRSWITAVAAAVAVFFLPAAATQGVGSQGSELRVFTTQSIATVLEKIGADFERRTGGKLSVTTDLAVRLVRRINDGEQFDFLVAAPAQIDELIKAGKIIPETRTDLAHSGIGVAVRAGAPKPDVSSVEAFKRALLAARSVAYLKEGQSGVYVAGLLERLGIAETIQSKVTLPETDIVSELVSRGEIELGIVVITQILTTDGVALAGPLPSEIQSYITFTAGISASSKSIDAATQLLTVLKSPAAIDVMRSRGWCPPNSDALPASRGAASGTWIIAENMIPRGERLSGRPVVGASVVVKRLRSVRDALQASRLKPVAGTTGTILLPPEQTTESGWNFAKAAERRRAAWSLDVGGCCRFGLRSRIAAIRGDGSDVCWVQRPMNRTPVTVLDRTGFQSRHSPSPIRREANNSPSPVAGALGPSVMRMCAGKCIFMLSSGPSVRIV